jgi:predicted amidophosphoribosyltransferase
LPPVWSTRPYAGAVRSAVVQSKDADRRDLLAVLAPLLADALVAAIDADTGARALLSAGNGPVFVVPVPSSGSSVRRRGDAVLHTLLSRALVCAAFAPHEAVFAPALRVRRRVADQAGLSHQDRAANLDHALEVRAPWRASVSGTCCLLADDVLTTGATLDEAARALRAAGAGHVLGATIAATARHGAGRRVTTGRR